MQFKRIVIDKYIGPAIENWEDLRVHYGTGQAFTYYKRHEKMSGYRIGKQTNIGDIEVSEWSRLVEDMIDRKGERVLHQKLILFLEQTTPWKNKKAIKEEALEIHADRLFENKEWVCYEAFNSQLGLEDITNGQ